VVVGKGAVVAAGSVVTTSVPRTLVQGNPARPQVRVAVPPRMGTDLRTFVANLRPLDAEVMLSMHRDRGAIKTNNDMHGAD